MDKPAAWGDDEALAELVREHYARVQRFGARACRDADAADDVVQEAFIKLPPNPLEVSAPRLVFAPLAAFSSST